MKKWIASVLVLCMAASMLGMSAQAASYGDVREDAAYAQAAQLLTAHGVMSGVGGGRFDPEGTVTRAQAVTALARLAKAKSAKTDDFTDVDPAAWYAGYVGWAVENGIVQDGGDGRFLPDAPVTGADLDGMLNRYAALTEQDLTFAGAGSGTVSRGELALRLTRFLENAPALPAEGAITDYAQREGGAFATAFESRSQVTWFPSGDGYDRLYGRFYYPADFDPAGTYPTVLLAHGGAITSDIYDAYYAPALAAAGYVCFSYDVRGVEGSFGRGSYSTNVNGLEASLDTYVADANAALDFIGTKAFVDPSNIYMWGQSMGAVTTQVITADRGSELRGSILLYGSVSDFNVKSFTTDSIDMQAKLDAQKESFAGEALFILGSDDVASYEVTVDNMAFYGDASLVYISGAGHGFGYMADRAAITATESVIDFIQRTSTASTLVPEVPFGDQFHKAPADPSVEPDEAAGYPVGYTVNFDGGCSKVVHVPSTDGLDQIYGRIYYPAGFDGGKTYPTILMAHGSSITSDIYDTYYAPAMAAAGFVCITYDVRGVEGSFGRSSYSTNNAHKPNSDLDTYVEDALAMLRYTKGRSFVDTGRLFMWGQSMGAITTQIVTSLEPDAFKGTLLLYGAISDANIASTFGASTSYDLNKVLADIKAHYAGESLFVLGMDDDLFSYEHTIGDAAKMTVAKGETPFNGNTSYYGNYTFLYISGANHGFGYAADRPTVLTTQTALDYFGGLSK